MNTKTEKSQRLSIRSFSIFQKISSSHIFIGILFCLLWWLSEKIFWNGGKLKKTFFKSTLKVGSNVFCITMSCSFFKANQMYKKSQPKRMRMDQIDSGPGMRNNWEKNRKHHLAIDKLSTLSRAILALQAKNLIVQSCKKETFFWQAASSDRGKFILIHQKPFFFKIFSF